MRFLHPEMAWWVLTLFAVAVVVRRIRRRRLGLAATSLAALGREHRVSLFRRAPSGVLFAALALLALALMDPVVPFAQHEVRSLGLDIVIALDLSASMQEQMGPGTPATRLDATKAAIKAFVARRVDDRIGLVIFSDNAYVISPLTFDHASLSRYIDFVDNDLLRGEGMTAIGEGLALSTALLARQPGATARGHKVIVVFTDGENTMGRDPLGALQQADAADIRVHLVGIALDQEVRTKPKVQALLRAVGKYGGRSFNASSASELEAASRTIDGIEKGVLVRRTSEHDAPVYDWFAIPALICLAGVFALRAVPAFVDQT
jgi:Ca-activated chloride channel family protein